MILRLVYFPIMLATMSLAFASYAQDRLSDAAPASDISLSGKVAAIEQDAFVLDYGAGRVRVDLEDGLDWFPAGTAGLTIGEPVTVNGVIDDDMFDTREIEATSIYRQSMQTYLYSDTNNSRFFPPVTIERRTTTTTTPSDLSYVSLSGTVKGISGRQFVLDTGVREFTVSTDAVSQNPNALARLRPGTRVSVSGVINGDDIFDRQALEATHVVVLAQPSRRVTIRRE
ncbi:MAG: hypothetical protein AB7E79_15285 [Rhodospirillaceae bacterium]